MNGADRAAEGRCMMCMARDVDGWFCVDCAMATTQQHNGEEMQGATGASRARQSQYRLARDSAHEQWMAMLSIPDIPSGRSRQTVAARRILDAVRESLPGDWRAKDWKQAARARKTRRRERREFYSADPDGQRPMASMYRRRSTTTGSR